jgi:WD40 repeat protein
VATLKLLEPAAPAEKHEGEVFCCAYTADGALVLSAGWDGHLRVWDATNGAHLLGVPVSNKPLSCCAFSPDGQQWLAGSMEGLLSVWDAVSYQMLHTFVAHTRPISAIVFSPDGKQLATASWDRQIVLRQVGQEREGRVLAGHRDIVGGVRFTSDSRLLVSWSHDGTVRLWEVDVAREVCTFGGHADRVTALALSPDNRWAVSGGRDGVLQLWDLEQQAQAGSLSLGSEIRACVFLLDGESVALADARGMLTLLTVPSFEVHAQVETAVRALCAELAPSGAQLALGGEDGRVHFAGLEGFEDAWLVVQATPALKQTTSLLGRFLGKTKVTRTFQYTCPACRQQAEVSTLPTQPVPCRRCQRLLRVHGRVPVTT